MSISGALAASFFDDGDTSGTTTAGTVVQFNHLDQGSEFYHNSVGEADIRGNEIYAADESHIELGVTETEGLDQIRSWMNKETDLKFCLAGLQDNILWYEPAKIKINKTFNFAVGNRNFNTVSMHLNSVNHKIWSGVNLMHGANVIRGFPGWGDEDGDDLPDGYENLNNKLDNFVFSRSNGKFSANGSTTGSSSVLSLTLLYPISNLKVTMSSRIESLQDDGLTKIGVICYDFENNVLSSANKIVVPKREFLTFTTNASAYKLSLQPLSFTGVTVQNVTGSCSYPALRTDGSDLAITG